MHDLLFDSLSTGATLITVNHRLARGLRSRYNSRQIDRGLIAWRTPAIASFDAWCDGLWSDCVDAGAHVGLHLPSSAQEAALWERIVDESPEAVGLILTSRTARQALEAWCLAAEWRIPVPNPSDPDLNDDCRAFARWATRYARELAERGWVDRARLADRLVDALDSGLLEAPAQLWLAGFDEATPQQDYLFAAMERHGAKLIPFEPPRHDGAVLSLALDDAQEELTSAARWARNLLDGPSPGAIGIVVPSLESVRARIDATFSDYLLPSAVLPESGEPMRPFNISCGRPLSEYPVVATALLALELCTGRVAIERIGALLRSPFLGGAEAELSNRALLDARLRRYGRTEITFAELRREADAELKDPAPTYRCPSLVALLDAWNGVAAGLSGASLRPSDWAQKFAAMLDALGWPGEREVTGSERQTIEKWWELLSSYATLDGIIPNERAMGAVRRLARMAAGTEFQTKTDDAPVQILGTLEAAGMRFDHLWIVGMHDEEMPATPKPNPFLPIRLQRSHRVARASAERELEFARTVVNGLLASAPDVVVSYPASDGERPLEPSPLIAHLSPHRPEELAWSAARHFATIIHESGERESLVDEQGPAVAPGVPVHGGTSILRDQAACGFRAFATHRLGAKPLDRPAPGLDAMERGKLMHSVLETLWLELRDHATLVALDDDQLDALIERHVVKAVAVAAAAHPETFSERFAAIERRRLARITRQWLVLERERLPFRMKKIEEEQWVTLGGVQMRVRIDRIDELHDGRQVFIDYKTSQPSSSKWFGDRPDEPQLPIYCTTCDDVAAVLFVQLKPHEVKFNGIAAESGIVPGVKEFGGVEADGILAWEQINPRWRAVLTSIGEQFMNGHAAVAPKKPSETCRYCEVGPLCRIKEMSEMEEEL
jgi:ATP-dependent helicase/nuclease subunit B